MNIVKSLLYTAVAAVMVSGTWMIAAQDMKVPDSIALRIRNVQRDQIIQSSKINEIASKYQQQYQTEIAPFKGPLDHDTKELEELKAEALTNAHLNAAKYEVDTDKLEFVEKKVPEVKK